MVKLPEPVQPLLPVKVQVPVMVLPFATVPFSFRELPDGDPDCTVMPKLPFTWPLKFPPSVKEPLSVSPEAKHGELVVKLKLATLTDPSPFTDSDVPNAKLVVLLLPISVAFQFPLTLAGLVVLEPHPTRTRPAISKAKKANCFIEIPQVVRVRRSAPKGDAGSGPVASAPLEEA
jgi:hypothetical protein